MDGYALVDNYPIDYGEDGDYSVGTGGSYTAGCPDTIDIIGVTVKSGSIIKKGGFIGGGASGGNTVNITDCTIESGVKIGCNADGTPSESPYVGSFAGRISGTISNCVSYADVYGTNHVGGIVGHKSQSMGPFNILNCKFYGNVIATGSYAGGIVGSGYTSDTAPNTPCVTIENCLATGTVTGSDYVGGIIGIEKVVQCWDNGIGYIRNNRFTGTINASSAEYVGGIIGYMRSLNRYTIIENNYFSSTCKATNGIGGVEYIDTNCSTHETASGVTYINTEGNASECPTIAGCDWRKDHNRTDDPLGADAAKLCYTESAEVKVTKLDISGKFKTEYLVGEKLDLTGIVLTATWSDGTTSTPMLDDVTVSSFDSSTPGEKTIIITYRTASTSTKVTVKKAAGKIDVTISVLGDSKHGDSGSVHTYAGGGLTPWVSATTYSVDSNATVWTVLKKCLDENGYSYSNPSGNYVVSINGLAEFTNGKNSGWMYTLNGSYPTLGVSQQYLNDGDVIVFHYTDDYTVEKHGFPNDKTTVKEVIRLIDKIGTVTLNSKDAIQAARAAYNKLSATDKDQVYNYDTLTAAEAKLSQLQVQDAINKINLIGTVTLNSGSKIDAAWNAYNPLTTEQKLQVTNRGTLAKAQETYNNLKAEETEKLIDEIDDEITLESEDAIVKARKAYDALTKTQQGLVDKEHLDKLKAAELALAELKATETDKEKAQEVIDLIKKLGTITMESAEDVEAARAAYEKLTDIQKTLVTNYDDLVKAEDTLEDLCNFRTFENIYINTGDYMETLGVPNVGSIGGEWMVIGMARSGRIVPDGYYDNVLSYVELNIDENERLHNAKSTDNSRLILALTAIGKDVTDVGGHNLLAGLNEMKYIQYQGINGPIWALIAFDSGNYPVPTDGDVTREILIQTILDAQLADGGWALSGSNADSDMTGMALQALAPYYGSNEAVKLAVDAAVETLSLMQNADGSFSSVDGASSESISQVIVALTALGINPDKDERFIKNDISVLDALISYYVTGGGFRHIMTGERDGMATEQAYYALTAYYRFLMKQTSLYDMTDVIDMGGDPEVETTLPTETEAAEEPEDKGGFPWWVVIVVLCAGGACAAVVILLPKFKKGKFL